MSFTTIMDLVGGALQLAAAAYALRLIRLFGTARVGWSLFCAFSFLALIHLVQSATSFNHGASSGIPIEAMLPLVSFLLFTGMVHLETLLKERMRLQEQERIHHQAMVTELAKAADYARSLLPARLSGEVESEWCFHPCEQLGGDAFGYNWIDPDHLAIYLLDVCGHGVGAALLSVSVLNTLRTQTLSGVDFRDPAAILGALNHSFRMDDQNNLYFTAWYGVYRRKTRELVYASGGHPPAILVGPNSSGPADVFPLRIRPATPAVGLFNDVVYRSAIQKVVPGSRLLVFSDGVFEIFGPNEKVGTWEEFFAGCKSPQSRGLRPGERLEKARETRGKDLLEDDFSLVELRFN